MSDSSPASAGAKSADADREARIEQLLVSGLDQYFAGQYQQAINIWTRVVFLERGHSRARAYIERARSAMAERQRECEELVQNGIDAYNAGEISRARELLTHAVEQGGRSDTAELFLDRLSRVTGPAVRVADTAQEGTRPAPDVPSAEQRRVKATDWVSTVLLSALAAAVVLFVAAALVGWFTDPAAAPIASPERTTIDPLPIVRPSEILVARARDLFAGGRLRDALRTLEEIDQADPQRPAADRLRADVQRALLETAGRPR